MDPIEQNQISFTEFAQEYRERIEKGEKISVTEFLTQVQTYREGKEFSLSHKKLIYDLLTDPENAPKVIQEVLESPVPFVSSEQSEASQSDTQKEKAWELLRESRPQKPSSVASRESWGIVQKTLEENKINVTRAREIVQQFNSRVQKLQVYGAAATKPIDLEKNTTPPTFEEIRKELTAATKSQNIAQKQELQAVLEEYAPQLTSKEYTALRAADVITATVIETPEVPMAVFVDAVERGYDRNRAESFAYTATVVNTPGARTSTGGPAAAIMDVVTTVFPGLQYASMEHIVAEAWEQVTKSEEKIAEITSRIGEGVAQNTFIHQEMPRPQSGLGNVFSGFSSSAPKITDEEMIDYAELLYRRSPNARIEPAEVFASHGLHMIHFDVGGSPLDWVAQWAAKKKAGNVAATALGVGAKATAREVGIGLLAKLGIKGALGTLLGGPVGFVVMLFADKLLAWGGKALAGIGSAAGYLMSGGVFTSILSGKAPSLLDTLAFFPVVLVVVFVSFLVFPWFLNLQQFPEEIRRAALVTSMGGEGPYGEPTDCDKTPDAPVCSFEACEGDCRWPTSGIITQGPRPSCGSHAGGTDENGIDIASSGNPAVYAMVDGKVDYVFTGCEDNTGSNVETDPNHNCGDGWGNHIIVSGTAGNGKTYKLIFSHLLKNIPFSAGDSVTPTTAIGKMDDTGYSSGSHLHFGVLGDGNVLDLVPDNYPGVSKAQVDGCNGSCGKACPATPVSAG